MRIKAEMLVSITDNIRYHEYNHMKRISRFGAIERLILRFGCVMLLLLLLLATQSMLALSDAGASE